MSKSGENPSKRARKSSTEPKEAAPTPNLGHSLVERPPVCPLDLGWVKGVRVNSAAINRRAGEIGTRRTVKKDYQAAWELRAVTCKPVLLLPPPNDNTHHLPLPSTSSTPRTQAST